jgi:hypothetical protein
VTPAPDYWPSIISASAGLAGAGIGGLISYFAQRSLAKRQFANDRAALAMAFLTEIEMLLEQVAVLQHMQRADEMLKRWTDMPRSLIKPEEAGEFMPSGSKSTDGLVVYLAKAGDIGRLGTAAKPVARFYSLILTVREGILAFQRGERNSLAKPVLVAIVEEEIARMRSALEVGANQAIPALKKLAKPLLREPHGA